MDLVSVIMPTYNSAKWVADTIDSIIAQTYPNIELIVVDDGSSDDTVSVVERKLSKDFKHKWQVLELGGNHGPSAARNAGLRLASGAWVQYLDSDDFLAPSKFALQMAYCNTAPLDVSAVYSPWRRCFHDAGKITWDGLLVSPDMKDKAPIMCLVGGNRPLHSAGLARRSTLEQIGGFDEDLRFWETEELNIRLAKAGRLESVPASEPMYLWRMHRERIYIGRENARYQAVPVAFSWIDLMLKESGHRTLDQLNLSQADRAEIHENSTVWGRLLYAHDRAAFRQYVARARELEPDLAPSYPKYVAAVSRYVGYEGAEAIARLGRSPKTVVRKILEGLKLRPQQSVFDWN